MLTHDRLTELLSYDPDSGRFVWLQSRSRTKAGSEAGSINRQDGYRLINIDGQAYQAHRLAWFFVMRRWPAAEIDHVNGSKADNRLCNLREASRKENQRNVGLTRANTSGFKGVYWHPSGPGWWRASIRIDGHNRHLGLFPDRESAARAYQRAAVEAFGEFACVA